MQRDNWGLLIGWFIGLALGLLPCGTGHAEPRPAVVMPPSGQPIYVHPAPAPYAPAVILTPAPIYVHPAPSTYAPATVITPGAMPTFVYPG